MNIETTKKEDEFFGAYCAAINFTETGDTDQPEDAAELCEVFKRESLIDCLSFYARVACYVSDDKLAQAGHDFWLTRNRHGTGFWDDVPARGWSEWQSKKFTVIAEGFGEVDALFEELI